MEKTSRGRDFYLAYLQTPEWRMRRSRALQQAQWRCSKCAGKRDLQVHHVTYERLGREWDSDLRVLCANCHEGEHVTEIEQGPNRFLIRIVSEAMRLNSLGDIGDLTEMAKQLCAKYHVQYRPLELHRAVQFIAGARLTRVDRPRALDRDIKADPPTISAREAHELLTRIGSMTLIRSMPVDELSEEAFRERQAELQRQKVLILREART